MASRKCEQCGRIFTPNSNGQFYCSKLCRDDARATRAMAKKAEGYICAYCGKRFTSDRKKKYCSDDCCKRAWRHLKPITKRTKPKKSIVEIALLAREKGLTYGQYVAKYGL